MVSRDASPGSVVSPAIVQWNFAEGLGDGRLALADGAGSSVVRTTQGIRLDGVHDFLVIPRDRVGELDIARTGHSVSVVARVRRASLDTGFIAGLWQEHDHDPRRQYGLFVSLPTYGGSQQVIGHVSADGAPSDDLPYSRDYSASARMVAPGEWRVVGFSYDGEHVTSYLDGAADARPEFTERGAPLGARLSYAKNPYRYPHGLNSEATSEFTVGAVRLTAGMGNFFAGDISHIAIWDEALTAAQMMQVALDWTGPDEPLMRFDFYRPDDGVDRLSGGWDGPRWPLAAVGWSGNSPRTWVEPRRIVNDGGAATVRFDGIEGLRADEVRVSFTGDVTLREVVRDEWLTGIAFEFVGAGELRDVRVERRA